METLRGLESLPDPRLLGSTVTWGVFDGVHRGHRRLLRRLTELACDGPSVVITFDPHPTQVLQDVEVPLLCTISERLELMAAQGIGFVLVVPFTAEFARKSAEEFVRDIVLGRLGARRVLLGHDSHFGKDRHGNDELLRRLGIEVHPCEPEMEGGRPISSSLIRQAISEGQVELAATLLGRPVCMRGTVIRGDRRGTRLGYPTANLEVQKALHPPRGVYSVETLVEGRAFLGVANLGTRPTFYEGGAPELLEVHLLAYPGGDLYGRKLEVRFCRRLRDEVKFADVEDLRKAMADDVAQVKKLWAKKLPSSSSDWNP